VNIPPISGAVLGDAAEFRAMFREYAASIGDNFWVRDFEDELAAFVGSAATWQVFSSSR